MKNKILTIPNLLTLLRLLMVPVFVWAYTVRQDQLLTALILALSGLTDLLDGQIARRCNMVSDLGKLLDPIADKVTQGVMLICLIRQFPAMWVPTVLLVIKEGFVGTAHVLAVRESGRIDGADMHGKVATVCLDALALIHLLWPEIPHGASACLIAVTCLAMAVSFAMYARTYIGMLRPDKKQGRTK